MIRRFLRSPTITIVILPLFLFLPSILRGEVFYWGTPILQFFPWRFWAWQTLLEGHIPLWNPLTGMGSPLLANYQSGLFYPPNWLSLVAFALGGIAWMTTMQTILVVFHLIWAGLGTSLLLKKLNSSELAQTIGGLAFCMSGYLVARAGFFSINAAVAWVPWVILFTHSLVDQKKRVERGGILSIVELVVVLVMQLLSGHAQITWMTLMLAFLWSGFQGVVDSVSLVSQSVPKWKFSKHSIKSFLHLMLFDLVKLWSTLVLSVIIAVGLTAIQLFPTLEYLLQSQRATAVDYEFAMTYSFWPWHFLNLIAPNFFGNPANGDYWGYGNYWEDATYIGLFPFAMSILALFSMRRSEHRGTIIFFIGLIGISFVFALGANTPIYPWFYRKVPGFQMFQAPARFTLWAVFALSILSGLGVDHLSRPQGRSLYWFRLATAGCLSLVIGSVWLYFSHVNVRQTMIYSTATTGLLGFFVGLFILYAPISFGNEAKSNNQKHLWDWLVILFVMSDLTFFDRGLNPTIDRKLYVEEAQNIEQIRKLTNNGRIFIPPLEEYKIKFERFFRFDTYHIREEWTNLRAMQLPNINLFDHIPSANNFDPLIPYRYAHWMEVYNRVYAKNKMKMLKLMNVSAVLRFNDMHRLGVTFDGIGTYPRFRWVPCALWVHNGEEAIEVIFQSSLDLTKYVVLEKDEESYINDKANCDLRGKASIEVEKENPNHIELHIHSRSPGYLIISDVWYPGWIAFVNNQRMPILKANYLFRGVLIPEGENRVVMIYCPISFYSGMVLSIISWIFFIGFIIKSKVRSHLVVRKLKQS